MLGATEIVLQGSYGSMESRPTTLGSGNAAFALPVLLEQINTEVDINAINGAADEFLTSGPATPLDDLVEPAADQNVQINTAPKTTVGKQHGRKTRTSLLGRWLPAFWWLRTTISAGCCWQRPFS